MKVGFIGLGRMGKNIVLHLLEQGVDVVVYNRTRQTTDEFLTEAQSTKGLFAAATLQEFIQSFPAPRIVFLSVSAGKPVDEVLDQLIGAGLTTGDIVIDGGNSFYKDSVARYDMLKKKGISYIDCGTSGGLEGARNGACLMLGGDEGIVKLLSWLWEKIAMPGGFAYVGPSGAGHFVKMVHNGVEYGMNQAIGEGFEMLAKGPYSFNLPTVANNWTRGSVVRGWLVELLARALLKDPNLDAYIGTVGGGETGMWTVNTAKELGISVNVLEASLAARKKSQTMPTFATKVVSALRNEYGGHTEKK